MSYGHDNHFYFERQAVIGDFNKAGINPALPILVIKSKLRVGN